MQIRPTLCVTFNQTAFVAELKNKRYGEMEHLKEMGIDSSIHILVDKICTTW